MPALSNVKHEAFARKYAETLNGTKAYQETYNPPAERTATLNASRLLQTNAEVKPRILEILEQKGLTDGYLSGRIFDHVANKKDGHLSLKAIRTALELKGYLNKDQVQALAKIVFAKTIVNEEGTETQSIEVTPAGSPDAQPSQGSASPNPSDTNNL